MYITLKRQEPVVEHAGVIVRLTRTLQSAVLVFLAATVVNVSPATAAQQLDSQVTFKAYRDHRGLMIQDGGDWPSSTTGQGAVDAYWEHGAIRLAFKSADASAFRTDVFERIDGRRTTPVLGPRAETNLDVRGVYRAELRDTSGVPVGWLRVSVSPFDVPPRVYDGSVPTILGPQMITAALARLDAEVDWIEAHAPDVNLGN
jgi:hypothetical protein